MRILGTIALLSAVLVLGAGEPAGWAMAPGERLAGDVPTREAESETVDLRHLFDAPVRVQSRIRQLMESAENLPKRLAKELLTNDAELRWTCLVLIREEYGDQTVVPGVQALLGKQLAQPAQMDPAIVTACCEILGDWPRWDSIPELLAVLEVPFSADTFEPFRTADASLRLITGYWPVPEPPGEPNSMLDPAVPVERSRRLILRAWTEWWEQTSKWKDALPEVRFVLDWYDEPAEVPADGPPPSREAIRRVLWVRPTGIASVRQTKGLAHDRGDPQWRWTGKVSRLAEVPLDAPFVQHVRSLENILHDAPAAQVWSVPPADDPRAGHWAAQVTLTDATGRLRAVELVVGATPNGVPASAEAIAALAGLLPLFVFP